MSYYDHIVFEGGGSKGILYAGVAIELERMGILNGIKSVGGASAGAMASLLFSTGWSAEKITSTLKKLDFADLVEGGVLNKIKAPVTFIESFGLFEAKGLHDWLGDVVQEVTGSPNTTFEEWHKLGLKDIYVEATNDNTGIVETFSWETDHKDVPIRDAIRASSAFPGVFTPVKIKGIFYSDGGIQNNCPSDIFSKNGEFNPRVLTCRVDSEGEIKFYETGVRPPSQPINNIIQFLMRIFNASLNAQNANFYQSPYKENTIFGDTLDLETLDFHPSEEKMNTVIASGQYSTILYFLNKHPEVLEKANYDPKLLKMMRDSNTRSFKQFVEYQKSLSAQKKQAKLSASEPSIAGPSEKIKVVEELHRPHKLWKLISFDAFKKADEIVEEALASSFPTPAPDENGYSCRII